MMCFSKWVSATLAIAVLASVTLIAGGGSTPVADVTASGPADTLVVAPAKPGNPLVITQDQPVVPLVVTQDQPVVYCCGGGPAYTSAIATVEPAQTLVSAQDKKPVAGEAVTPAQFSTKLKAIDKQLTSIEALVAQIEAAKTDKDKDKYADDLEPRLDAYAKAMLASINTALKQAELSAKSNGKEGSFELLKSFEDLAVKHEGALKKIETRTRKLKPASKSSSNSKPGEGGKVALDSPMLEESGHFFFVSMLSPGNLPLENLGDSGQCSIAAEVLKMQLAAIAYGVAQTNAATTVFNNCWNKYDGIRPKWVRALLRVGCTAVYVARLA